jgi:hypothetical protein
VANTSIVHQHVQYAEGLFGLVEQLPHVFGFGDIAFYGNGSSAFRVDVGDAAVRVFLAEE